MNLNSNKTLDIFHPFILAIMVFLFVVIAIPMWYFSNRLPAPKMSLYLYIGLGILFFAFGIFLSNFIVNRKLNPKPNNGSSLNSFKENKNSSNTHEGTINSSNNLKDNENLLNSFKDKIKLNSEIPEKLNLFGSYSRNELTLMGFVLLGILFQVVNISLLGGIPLFDANLKARAATKLWLLSYIIFLPSINILLARFNRDSHYLLVFLGLLLFALTGYRTTPITILLSIFITLFYTRNIKLRHQIFLALAIIAILIGVGFIAVKAISWQNWSLNPLELLSYRAAFTLNVLQRAVEHQFVTGGTLFYSTLTGFFTHIDPRNLVGIALLGRNHSITSTIFGPALMDFGIVGMSVQMLLIGFILKTLHSIAKYKRELYAGIYGILLAQSIIWIETGPTDVVVWIFYIIAILLIVFSFYNGFEN
ncbi:oligosaccharide repeat unit polymerase family protein [uncultured Methanobrevibacter sp.]|uniref:oligosaccharide repeat unit polymerase family protein n=1 Tax=uncultured Methanobrevibacter sp. TaxID=253161 RepID=UPI002605A888